jgi:competence protein ComEA
LILLTKQSINQKEIHMKARNLLVSFVATLIVCWGSSLFADDGQVESSSMEQVTVNINHADAQTLANVLVGVGIARAEAIVAYREENGKFYSAEELTAVRGIGDSTIAKNNSKIVVK